MRVLFAHQSFPGQFRYLAPTLAAQGHEVVFMSLPTTRSLSKIQQVFYDMTPPAREPEDQYIGHLLNAMSYARAAAATANSLKRDGFVPDVIIAHPGWGESLFLRDIFSSAKMLLFLEFFSRPENSYYDFDRTEPLDFEERVSLRMRNVTHLMALNDFDWAFSPTLWQKSLFPVEYQSRISTIHDGINIEKFKPRDDLSLVLPSGKILKKGMEVITFVSRHLEPCRGLNTFMRAVEIVLRKRPNCEVLIYGRSEAAYGPENRSGKTHLDLILDEVDLDRNRLHLFGFAEQPEVIAAMSISSAHVFFTYPFLISWSVLEALAMECILIASATAPLQEFIQHGQNGILVDFFDHTALADQLCEVLENQERYQQLRKAARETVLVRFNASRNVAKQISILSRLHAGDSLAAEPVISSRESASMISSA